MTKTKLAVATFGRGDGSSRVRISSITAKLREGGAISERAIGRERVVELTDRGRAELKQLAPAEPAASPGPPIPALITAVNPPAGVETEHGNDRVRFHLRHAALLALMKLRAQPTLTRADEHMEGVLTALVDETTNPLEDRRLFDSLRHSWTGAGQRKRLMEALVTFENPKERRRTGTDLLALGETMRPGVDAILWASAAIDLAHHYSFAPTTQVERLTARRLLHMAKSLMIETRKDPDLAVAASYRLAKVGKVGAVGWSWSPVAVRRLELSGDKEQDALATELGRIEDQVRQAGEFNDALEHYDLALARHIGRWVMTAMPSSEWVFRRVGGGGIGKAIEEWANSMRESGALTELLTTRVAASPELQVALRKFLEVAPRFEDSFGSVVEPHVAQANALLGATVPSPSRPYEAMLLNNLWTPEMVAVDAIVPATA